MYDEPTAGLDPVASTVVEDLMRALHTRPSSSYTRTHSNGNSKSGSSPGVRSSASSYASMASMDGSAVPINPNAGITSYIVVTHQHSTIRRSVDRLIFLHEGRVVWEGTTPEFDTTAEPIVRQFSTGSLTGPIAYV